jgi:HSP20 family protein
MYGLIKNPRRLRLVGANSPSHLFAHLLNSEQMKNVDNIFSDIGDIFETEQSNPSVNVSETDNNFHIDVALPGLDKSKIDISLEDGLLTISSKKETESKEEGKDYMRKEFSYSSFTRSFTLPENADEEGIKSKFENGLLNINIPKKTPTLPTKKVIAIE